MRPGQICSDEIKARMRAAANTPEERKRRSESAKRQFSTSEGRAKASAASKKRYEDPAERERSRIATKKQFENPEIKEKHARSLKLVYSDPMIRSKISTRAKERWSDPSERARHSARLKEPGIRKAISEASKNMWSDPDFHAAMSGENAAQWRGGISFEPYCPKFNKDLKNRVRQYFNNECIICGRLGTECKKGLSVHHVEYNKSACCDGQPVHFAALCGTCHGKTNHNREKYEAMLHRIIDEIYDGRSYYTREEWDALRRKD